MTKSFYFISTVFVAFGVFVLVLPQKGASSRTVSEEEALLEWQQATYHFTADELADLLINRDPEIRLIDVRDSASYNGASVPGSINIPLDSLFTDNWIGYIDQGIRKNILIASSQVETKEIWLRARMRGFENNYVLVNGYEGWQNSILNPEIPATTADELVWIEYRRRLAAKAHFTGEVIQQSTTTPVVPIQRKKKKMVEGGCS